MKKHLEYIILFDGDCGICNSTQLWIKSKAKRQIFDIHPYQDYDYSIYNLSVEDVSSSVYLIKNGKIHSKSGAVFEILKELPFPYKLIGFLFSNKIMSFLFNPVYNYIAKNRAKISALFGLNSCKI